jgi:hypothetical protein
VIQRTATCLRIVKREGNIFLENFVCAGNQELSILSEISG